MAKRLWVGLDVGVDTTSVCVIDTDGAVLRETVCPTDAKSVHREIVSLGCRRSGVVGLEAGTGSALARELRALGYTVEIYKLGNSANFCGCGATRPMPVMHWAFAMAGRIPSPAPV